MAKKVRKNLIILGLAIILIISFSFFYQKNINYCDNVCQYNSNQKSWSYLTGRKTDIDRISREILGELSVSFITQKDCINYCLQYK